MNRSIKHTLIASALLATLSLPALADRGPTGPMHMGPWAGLQQAKPQLKLTAEQTTLWNAAEAASQASRDAMRSGMEKARALFDEQKKQPILDLQKLSDTMEAQRDSGKALRDKERDAWLKLYASLNDTQKQTASEFIKQHWQHMSQRMEHMRRGKDRQ